MRVVLVLVTVATLTVAGCSADQGDTSASSTSSELAPLDCPGSYVQLYVQFAAVNPSTCSPAVIQLMKQAAHLAAVCPKNSGVNVGNPADRSQRLQITRGKVNEIYADIECNRASGGGTISSQQSP